MKLPTFRRLVYMAGVVLILSILPVTSLLAQEQQESGNGFRISPVRSELVIEKGRSDTLTLTLENPSDSATTARAVVNDFVASDKEDGEPRLILDENSEATPKNSFRSLVKPIADVQLGAREKKDITVTIQVKEDASAGGYYGAIRFMPIREGQLDGNVGLMASVGTIVLVRVPGDLTERLDLLQLSAAQKKDKDSESVAKNFLSSGGVQIMTRLKNSGDIHVQPFGKVRVKNMFGKTVAEYELNNTDPRANILPDSTRKFVDDLPDQKWLGRYTIVANLGYSQGSDLITAQSSFWYLPPWAIAVLVTLLVALAVGGYLLYRKYATPASRKK